MKKTLALLLAFMVLHFAAHAEAAPLSSTAAALDGKARWQEVLLIDWLYPTEPDYALLKSAASQANSKSWLVARMERNEKLPQASARELAFQLSQDPGVSTETKAQLTAQLADEPDLIKDSSVSSTASKADAVSSQFNQMSQRMDEIEQIYDTNRYGKGSVPAVNFDLFSSYLSDNTAGMVQGDDRGYFLGGINITLRGTLEKANYTFTIPEFYTNQEQKSESYIPFAVRADYVGVGAGFSFLLPLSDGGLEVHLGDVVPLFFSSLLFSSLDAINLDGFFVDVTQAYRPDKTIKELELGYPSGVFNVRGLVVKKQGSTWYWPFSNFQFVYTPDSDFFQGYDVKRNMMAARFDEEFGPHGNWLSNATVSGVVVNTSKDADQLLGLPNANDTNSETALSYSLSSDIELSSGTSIKAEGALSNYSAQIKSPKYSVGYNDSAWLVNATQPLGPIYAAVEAGMAGPRFFTSVHAANRIETGTVIDSSDVSTLPGAPAAPKNLINDSVMTNPAELSTNSQRVSIKAEWHGSWVSLGAYDGTSSQIEASGPFVVTAPYIEGSGQNGYGWFRVFGQSYGAPPNPGTSVAGPTYYQGLYNLPTAAVTNGQVIKQNWQQISQFDYQAVTFRLLLSQKGVGDNHILLDSLKTTNYLGGTMRFDFKPLFKRDNPFDLTVLYQDRDLAAQAGIPAFDDSNYFNQQIVSSFVNFGVTDSITILGTAAYETWKSKHSLFLLNIQTEEFGLGADFKLDPIVSGLMINLRASLMNHSDLTLDPSQRNFSLFMFSLGSTLSY